MGDRLVSKRGCGWGHGLILQEEGKERIIGQPRIYEYIVNNLKPGYIGHIPQAIVGDV